MKITIEAQPSDSIVIKELLSPWNVFYAEQENADVSVVYNQRPAEERCSVIIPSYSENFKAWAKENHFRLTIKPGNLVSVPATYCNSLSIKPKTIYSLDSSSSLSFGESTPTHTVIQENTLALKLNVIEEFDAILNSTLQPKESKIHRLATSMPIPYGLAPKRLKNFVMKSNRVPEDLTLNDKLPIDALRFSLVNAIEKASNKFLEKKSIFSDNRLCLLTHDVDTAPGLQNALKMKKAEEKYNLSSAWYIPSSRYKLKNDIIRELSNNGEVGAHDTKHDGKLAHLSKEKLIERFSDAKRTLEAIVERSVDGFRAPVLQHNRLILQTLSEVGFIYDTSIPTWEPKHPLTMKPHGIGTVYPLTINGLTEIPLTLPQDHQLLEVVGLKPEEVLKTWATSVSLIRDLGGICMFLVHPDYAFGCEHASLYEELVKVIASDDEVAVALPSRLCALTRN